MANFQRRSHRLWIASLLLASFLFWCVGECPAQETTPEVLPPVTDDSAPKDTVIMNDGKSVRGIVLEENEKIVRMIVIVGSLRAETTYQRSDVSIIRRGWVDPAAVDAAFGDRETPYVKPDGVLFTTPVLVRASARIQTADSQRESMDDGGPIPDSRRAPGHQRRTGKSSVEHRQVLESGPRQWTGDIDLCVFITCPDLCESLYAPGKELRRGDIGKYQIGHALSVEAPLTLKDEKQIRQALAKRALSKDGGVDNVHIRLFALVGGDILEGRLRNAKPQERGPSPGQCPAEEFERPMLIEWQPPSSPVGTNAILLTLFGSQSRSNATDLRAAAARMESEADYAETLLKNGIRVDCSHCGGDGQLTGADASRFSEEESQEYRLKVSAAAANAGPGVTKLRVVVTCRTCGGKGTSGIKLPGRELTQRLQEYIRLHQTNAAEFRRTADELLAKIKEWEATPSEGPDLKLEVANLERQLHRLQGLLADVARSRQLLDEMEKLLQQE